MRKFVQTLLRDERGVTAVEYGILAALIIGVLVGGAALFSDALSELWTAVSGGLSDAATKAS